MAERAWAQGLPIPADADHPARRWMARRHLWRPEIALPPSVRWLSADRWRWWDAAPDLAGAVVAAFAPPGTGRLSGVQLVHVDIEGRPVLDKPEAAGGLDKRSHGRMAGAVCVLGLPGQGGVNVAEGLADALPLAARLPWRAVCMGGTAGYHNAQLASWLAGLPHVGVWADLDEALQGLRAARVLASAIVGAGGYATVEHVGVGEDPGAAGAPFGTLGPEFATMAADLEREGLPAWEAARVAATILT